MTTLENDGLRNFEHLAWKLVKRGVIDEVTYDESVEAYINHNFPEVLGGLAATGAEIEPPTNTC